MMPLPEGVTVFIRKSPPKDEVNYTWQFQGNRPPHAYKFIFYLDQYPTFNCQITSIGHMDYLLEGTLTRSQALGALSEAYRLIGIEPKLIMVDVEETHMGKIDSYFENHILMRNPYDNTNGSKMCLYLVLMPDV